MSISRDELFIDLNVILDGEVMIDIVDEKSVVVTTDFCVKDIPIIQSAEVIVEV